MADSLSLNVLSLFATLRSKNPHRGFQAAQLASDLYTLCIESVSDTELAYCSSVLFNKDNGVLRFLRESATLEEFVNSKEELLKLLEAYVKILRDKILPYAVEIKEVCITLFSRDKASKVKNATFPTLIAILELCSRSPVVEALNVPKVADKFFQACLQPTKHTSTVRGGIFQLLGTLCEVYPECMISNSERLIEIYMRTLRSEMLSKSKKKPDMPVIGGCLRGLCSYLTNFSQSVAEGSAHAQDIYKFIRMAIDPQVSLTRYEVPRAGLSLVAKHAAQFTEYLAKDHEHMYHCLWEWANHNNRDNKKIALQSLDSFFKQVSVHIADNASKDRKTNSGIFKDFIRKFRTIIDNQTSGHFELAVAVKGYGYFARPCKMFMKPEDIHFMFSEMVHRSEQLFFSPVESSDDRLLHLPDFLGALASIVNELDELTESFLSSLEKLMVLLFECFPLIPQVNHPPTYYAVMRMIVGMATSRTALKSFLSNVVYQGLIRTCSHLPVVDVGDGSAVVSVEGATDILGNKRPSYLDYVDLWRHMMDPTLLKRLNHEMHDPGMRHMVHQIIYDEIISAILKIINRLNLSSKTAAQEPSSSESPTPPPTSSTTEGSPSPTDATSDPVSSLQPSVPKDFQIFINLVDLCKTLLPSVQLKMFEHWVHTFGREVIVQSSRHPLVSGFYKLLGICLKICKLIGYFKDMDGGTSEDEDVVAMETDAVDRKSCFVLFRKFVKEVLVRMRQYKDDLLASCLQLLLSLPNELVELEFEALVPALQTTFKLGLSYLPLANAGLDALELWSAELPASLLQPHFKHILPCLDDYLKTLGTSTESESDAATVMVQSRSARGSRRPVKVLAKWKEGIEGAESPQNKVRTRIVCFLGSLGGQVNSSLVETESAEAYASKAVSWDSKNRLEFALPFQDMKPSMFLDPFLPRICELATSSSDRQTKIAACELLHALILFLLGKSAQPAAQKKNPMTKLYRKLFPFILQLACDVERVSEQLFRPLVFQMIHWFTRNTQYENPDTIALLDAILDGIVHPTDTSLRDFCAVCVREFLVWSIKQTTKKQQEKSPINTKSLLKRIYSLALHPGAPKRLGAALAINAIYTVFREEDSMVDMFVIEMLVIMISSLQLAHKDDKSLGTQEQACLSIGHLSRIIKVKSTKLCSSSKTRRVPKVLKVAELTNLVLWLLSQSGTPETECRHQCMSLFVQFAGLVQKMATVRNWVRRTLESEGGSFFVSRFERGGHKGLGGIQRGPVLSGVVFSLSGVVSWFESIMAALDCYNWVFEEQLLAPSELFSKDESLCLFESLEFFITKLALNGIKAATGCFEHEFNSVHTPREVEEYNHSKCVVILKLLKFIAIVLTKHPKEAFSHVPNTFWSEDLLKLVIGCTMSPAGVGFSAGDVETMEQLQKQVKKTLLAFKDHLGPTLTPRFIDMLSLEIRTGSTCDLIGQLPLYFHGDSADHTQDRSHLNSIIRGHLLCQKASYLLPTLQAMGHTSDSVVAKLMDSVLGTLKPLVSKSSDSSKGGLLSPVSEQSTALLLELALEIGITPSVLVECLLDISNDCSGLGLIMYQSFSNLLNTHFLGNHGEIISLFLNNSQKKPESVSVILSGFLEYISRERSLKRKHGAKVCEQLLSQWKLLEGWWIGKFDADRRLGAINLLKKLVVLEPKILVRVSSDSAMFEPVFSMYLTLMEETQSSLVFKRYVLEVLHHFTSLSEQYLQRLKSSLNTLIAKQFPLKSTEFPKGSPQYNEYISVIEKMLNALVVSGSVMLLEVLIGIMCREQRHVHEEQIQISLVKFITDVISRSAADSIDVGYRVFTNEQSYPPDARRAACERVCVPLLRVCSEVALREFFLRHVGEIMATIEENLSKTAVESHLVSKFCCFQLMEVLYSRLPSGALNTQDSKINTTYCKGVAKKGNEMTQAATKAGHVALTEDLHGDKTHYELRRQYHCMAYNMLMSVITCTQNKIQFYNVFLFKEDTTKGQFLWDNIIDLDKQYQFDTELETPIKRKKQLTAIRDELRGQGSRESSPVDSPPFSPRYLSSQYLADSSLSADISQFDFSSGTQTLPTVRISPPTKREDSASYLVSEEQVEQDELNIHECMLPLMKLLDHMEHNKINPEIPKGTTPTEMPSWMVALHKKLNSSSTHPNVRLFIARLITNRPKIFQPYAKYWLPGLTRLIIGGNHGGVGMHYFVVDLMVTMLSWSTTAILEDTLLAKQLLEYLMEYSHHDNRSVLRNNLEIIKTLMESWKDKLQAPTKVIFRHFSQYGPESKGSRTGIQLLGVVVANKMPPYDPVTAGSVDEKRYFTTFVSLMSYKYKDVFAAAAEVLGMVLSYMDEREHSLLSDLKDIACQRLTTLAKDRNEDKFLTCLHRIQDNYPKLTESFVEKLVFLLPNFHGVFRSMCLEVLQPQADIRPRFYLELKDKGFHDMLSHRDEQTQLAALKIVQGMVAHGSLSIDQTATLLPLITAFGSHSSQSCRLLMYDILITLYTNNSPVDGSSPTDETTKKLLSDTRDQLLQGLADDAESIRMKMYAFWNEEGRLSSDTLGRLTQLLAVLYSINTERQFLYHSTNLMLELTSRSPDFNRSMFDSPLSECKFEDYTAIDLSWQQRHLQMTPLFAATQASQAGQTQMDQSVSGGMTEGALRATQQALAFTPTQDVAGGYNWMAPSLQSQDSSFTMGTTNPPSQDSSSLLFVAPKMRPPKRPLRPVGDNFGKGTLGTKDSSTSLDPQEERRREIMKLKRRFVRDRKITSAHFAKTEALRKKRREEIRHHQKAARDSRVVMYRKYRVGELPDIQIKHSELIRPFQALAQRDSVLARMLFAFLYQSVFAEVDNVLTDRQAESTKKAIRDGLNTVMESSTQFHPPFIGSLQDICFSERQLQLDPTAVSRACLTSMQEPIGIMLLEKQLLALSESGPGPRPSKRARGASAPLPEGTTTWVELARLYKSLGDFDTLRGIFSGQIGTKSITKHALEMEERGDYQEALRLYKEAISCEDWSDGGPMQVEEDFWDDSLLSCYAHLTEWRDLEKAALVNVDEGKPPKLDKIWDDAYYTEHYLPYVMYSKLKLACSGMDDPNFTDFLDRSLQDSTQRTLLESEYSKELALYSILKDDLDRARYYTGNCLQSFLQDWSNIDKLLVKSRAARLQSLQGIVEMQEYLDFMASTANFESTVGIDNLLSKWQNRFPHPKIDPICVWDDIITGRCMMMRKILEHFHSLSATTSSSVSKGVVSMDTDENRAAVNLDTLQERFSREFTNLYLRIANSARLQSNYAVATRYLQLTDAAIKEHFPSDTGLQIEWIHGVAEMKLHEAQQDPSPTNIEPLVAVVDRLGGYDDQDILGDNHSCGRKHYLLEGSAYNQLSRAFCEDGDLLLSVISDSRMKVLKKVIGAAASSASLTASEISHKLLLKCLSSFKLGVKSGSLEHNSTGDSSGMVQALVELASFCDRQLRLKEDDDIDSSLDTSKFPTVVMTYTLKAMQYGSRAATQQFPRLLQIVDLYPDTLETFKKKCCDVPTWMFISWIGQLVALLDKEEGPAVHEILFSIATDYPQALCYPFKISSYNFKFDSTASGKANEEAVARLKDNIKNRLVDDFVKALELLSSPELVFKDYCDNDLKPLLEASVPKRNTSKIKEIWLQIQAQLKEWDLGSSGSLYGTSSETSSIGVGSKQKRFAKEHIRRIEKEFGKDGGKLFKMQSKEFTRVYNALFDQMRPELNRVAGSGLLKDYSPWLNDFQGNQYSETMEIPGQYDGRSKPMPEYHVHISGFDEKVLVMSSIRKPKRIVIRGDDEKEYKFLVKGGEDLRLDQRIEQLFSTMNEVLDEDPNCSQHGLHLRTYQVVPMTPRVGLIEWMENTKPLKEFLQDALTEEEKKHYGDGGKRQNEWLHKYGSNNPEMYKNMYRKADRGEVEKEYRRKVTCVPWDLLKRAFMQLASSPEAFLTLRSHFIRTTSSVCMCQYVLGIGDRHLSNFMVDMESGGCIGIDFGHSFGTATQFLPFPELMPFRLTPQITNLLLPHREFGQLRSCMVHTLRALRNSPQLLLNTMDVFVKEPSLDWKSNARKQAKVQRLNEETYSQEGTWYPKEKLRQAKKKLLGYNPAHVMLKDLTLGHQKSQEYPALKTILMGDKKYNKRAQVGEKCESVEEQIMCLIDHATDPNILGRTWVGWEPWV